MKNLFYTAALFLLLCAAVFKFIFVGYGTMALAFFFFAVCCLFFGLLSGRKEKIVRLLRIAAILILLIGFICFMAAEIPVLLGSRSDEDTSADYVIVMGAGVNGYEPSLTLLNRLETAYDWLSENPDGIAILSGCRGQGEYVTEAQCMHNWLTERGIEPSRLIKEECAVNSYENIEFSLKLLAQNGGDPAGTVAVISNEYHLCRIRMIGAELGCRPVCKAARTPYLILYLNYAIREAFALWEIWVFGFGT